MYNFAGRQKPGVRTHIAGALCQNQSTFDLYICDLRDVLCSIVAYVDQVPVRILVHISPKQLDL
jgi:hypothetical protein